jgi:hypothetical protein
LRSRIIKVAKQSKLLLGSDDRLRKIPTDPHMFPTYYGSFAAPSWWNLGITIFRGVQIKPSKHYFFTIRYDEGDPESFIPA